MPKKKKKRAPTEKKQVARVARGVTAHRRIRAVPRGLRLVGCRDAVAGEEDSDHLIPAANLHISHQREDAELPVQMEFQTWNKQHRGAAGLQGESSGGSTRRRSKTGRGAAPAERSSITDRATTTSQAGDKQEDELHRGKGRSRRRVQACWVFESQARWELEVQVQVQALKAHAHVGARGRAPPDRGGRSM
ncbi:hypothetical protein ZWY2020_020119 [Hordeum vulgare]|nr:hypothetical protein ZWY2020_020119 [Hordeum vulgare]